MNQKHLVPQAVIDCAEKLFDENISTNAKENYHQRIEATKKFCEIVLEKMNSKKPRR